MHAIVQKQLERRFNSPCSANAWTELPSMPNNRSFAGCGLVRDAKGKPESVVVVGGRPRTNSVDVLDLASRTWSTGTHLTCQIRKATKVIE